MIVNYFEFKLESLLLESNKLVFSDKLAKLLGSIPNNRIKNILLGLKNSNKEIDVAQNYFDVTLNKDEITFIPDKRAQDILSQYDSEEWFRTTTDTRNRYLTYSKDTNGEYKNKSLFDELGHQIDKVDLHEVLPPHGSIGQVVKRVTSKVSGRTYCLFKWKKDDQDREICLNASSLVRADDRMERVWAQRRNPIRIGRLVRTILNASNEEFTDKEIEDFVNLYKSTFDVINDEFSKFDIVSGADIAYWYNKRNYHNMDSTLGSSCMANVDSAYFDIYTQNPDVCKLVILYSKVGQIIDGKWKSDKIRGRALLWTTEEGEIFMDRIYYNYESDVDLFKQFSDKNGWWHKTRQNSDSDFYAKKGETTKEATYKVKIIKGNFDRYPYVDTLTYLNIEKGYLSNNPDEIDADAELISTNGDYDNYDR